MDEAPILVCQCGRRLKAAGATPGRVGRCPSCGELLRVPTALQEPRRSPPSSEPIEADRLPTSSPRPNKTPKKRRRQEQRPTENWDGFLPAPDRPEQRLRTSLLYPLWGATGISLLIFAPPLLWLTSLPFLSLANVPLNDLRMLLRALLVLMPATLLFMPVASFVLLLMGRFLVSSAIGETYHPRWPEWEFTEMFRGLGRWGIALIAGGFMAALPATAYWLYCGDIDLIDASILIELAAFGVVYGQFALLASILHEDPLGANPVTVLRAIRCVGWNCLRPAACAMAFVGLMTLVWKWVFWVQEPLLSAFAYWLFWALGLYAMMVVLRILGLFYHCHARKLGWFRDRPRWGV
ncbi:hypothetical protein [Singulisphaera sp. PoT]|uniref:hypothetical protein n=1 Tax=Singulisphaera sp. PoT TaxID=3411797 RepID=UPI003BF49AE3